MVTLDSSTKKTGAAVWENGTLFRYPLIDKSNIKNMDERFEGMAKQIFDLLDTYTPDIIYIEETVVNRNVQTQRFLTRLQGVVYAWCIINKCEFNTIRPTEFREKIGIKQGRNVKRPELKAQAIAYVKDKYGIDVCDDVADAICIGDAVLKMFEEA